jgi:hypothetical protein
MQDTPFPVCFQTGINLAGKTWHAFISLVVFLPASPLLQGYECFFYRLPYHHLLPVTFSKVPSGNCLAQVQANSQETSAVRAITPLPLVITGIKKPAHEAPVFSFRQIIET